MLSHASASDKKQKEKDIIITKVQLQKAHSELQG